MSRKVFSLPICGFLAISVIWCATTYALSPIRTFIQENRYEEAVSLCRQFEMLSTNDSDNFFACAWVYYRTGRTAQAEHILDKQKRKYSLPEYQLLLAYGKMLKKDYAEAKKLMDAVANDNKGTAIGLTAQELQGENYELQDQLSVAAFIYRQVEGYDANRGWSHWGLGRYHLAQGETQRAITELELTAKLWPKHVGSRYDLAILALAQDDQASAFKWLNECYHLNRADPGVLEQLGLLFEKKGLINEAVRYWQKTLEIKKDSAISKEKLAKYSVQVVDDLIANRRYSEALAKIKTMDVGPQSDLLLRRGVIYRSLKNYEKAAIDLKSYASAHPDSAIAMRELGVCYLNLNLADQARAYFKRAAETEPDNGFNHAWLAWTLEATKEYQAARSEWRRALDLFKDPVEIEKATRRLSSVETHIRRGEGSSSKSRKDKGMDMGVGGNVEEDQEE